MKTSNQNEPVPLPLAAHDETEREAVGCSARLGGNGFTLRLLAVAVIINSVNLWQVKCELAKVRELVQAHSAAAGTAMNRWK